MSGVLTEKPKDLLGLMLINKYADDNVINVRLRIRGPPRRAVLLMLRRLESQCTGGARESEEVKVKGGKREGG